MMNNIATQVNLEFWGTDESGLPLFERFAGDRSGDQED